jgi:linoleate 10R-lipoxygenase
MESYTHYGVGPHTCLGKEVSKVALTAMLRVVGRLENLRRAPGPQGQLKKIPRPNNFYSYMLEDETGFYAFPMSTLLKRLISSKLADYQSAAFKVHFDGPISNSTNDNGAS